MHRLSINHICPTRLQLLYTLTLAVYNFISYSAVQASQFFRRLVYTRPYFRQKKLKPLHGKQLWPEFLCPLHSFSRPTADRQDNEREREREEGGGSYSAVIFPVVVRYKHYWRILQPRCVKRETCQNCAQLTRVANHWAFAGNIGRQVGKVKLYAAIFYAHAFICHGPILSVWMLLGCFFLLREGLFFRGGTSWRWSGHDDNVPSGPGLHTTAALCLPFPLSPPLLRASQSLSLVLYIYLPAGTKESHKEPPPPTAKASQQHSRAAAATLCLLKGKDVFHRLQLKGRKERERERERKAWMAAVLWLVPCCGVKLSSSWRRKPIERRPSPATRGPAGDAVVRVCLRDVLCVSCPSANGQCVRQKSVGSQSRRILLGEY